MARIVLVHGAWHGAWCFRWVIRELERLGHEGVAVDLPCEELGLGPREYARVVGAHPDEIVVGHSLGGLTVSQVEARTRVYLAAILPVENVYRDSFAEG